MYLVPDLRPTTYTVNSSRPTKRQTTGVRSRMRTVRLAADWNRSKRTGSAEDGTVGDLFFIWTSHRRLSPRPPGVRLILGRRLPARKGLTWPKHGGRPTRSRRTVRTCTGW